MSLLRYFENVLGVKSVSAGFFAQVPAANADASVEARSPVAAQPAQRLVLLDVGGQMQTPSLREMAAKITDAVRAEWMKHAALDGVTIEWETVSAGDDRQQLAGSIIVFGAPSVTAQSPRVCHVPGLREMQASPMAKRDGWRSIQESIRGWAVSSSQ